MSRARISRGRVVMAAVALASAAGLAVIPGTSAASTSDAAGTNGRSHGCERQLDLAAERDMQTFATFQAEPWRAMHHPDAISVFASGHTFVGIDAIMDGLRGHFEDKNATWEWRELSRAVSGCRSAYILYETTYAIPSVGFRLDALTGVSWTREAGRWLVTGDQGTPING